MKRFKIFFTGFVLASFLMVASPLVHAQQSDASLQLRPSTTQTQNGENFYVDVYVKNPSGQNLISVRSWLQYDPADLEVTSIERLTSPFALAAPGEDAAAPGEKLVKMGYSNIEGGSTATESIVSRVNFKVITTKATTTTIGFYDYQVSELGHTSANIISQGFPVNILSQKPTATTITLNGGAMEMGGNDEETLLPTPVAQEAIALSRPLNLKANTGDGYVHLKWDKAEGENVAGYYLYYGKTPGLYTRRKTLGSVNEFVLEGLLNGETYYFAVTAYDGMGNESDYSNEVGIIVGEPLSSTHPFEEVLANQMLANVESLDQVGPALNWFLIVTLGLGVVLGLGRRRKQT